MKIVLKKSTALQVRHNSVDILDQDGRTQDSDLRRDSLWSERISTRNPGVSDVKKHSSSGRCREARQMLYQAAAQSTNMKLVSTNYLYHSLNI